jgi:hypothetical protein
MQGKRTWNEVCSERKQTRSERNLLQEKFDSTLGAMIWKNLPVFVYKKIYFSRSLLSMLNRKPFGAPHALTQQRSVDIHLSYVMRKAISTDRCSEDAASHEGA